MRLRTSSCDRPGFTRVRCGRGFRYRDERGAPLKDPEHLARIRALVIPPAWRDVWICPWPGGHLQAVGTDDADRRQYLYHELFRAQQEQGKHEHVREVARALPDLRAKVATDLAGRGLSRPRVTACAVRLLDLGFFRIGSDRHTRESETYGLTTMLREHVTCGREEIAFSYPAKGGTEVVRALVDEQAHAVVRALLRRRSGGKRLLVYWDRPAWHDLRGDDLNEALRRLSGTEITAKDCRTWHATVLAAVALAVVTKEARVTRAPGADRPAAPSARSATTSATRPPCAVPPTSTPGSWSSSSRGRPSPPHSPGWVNTGTSAVPRRRAPSRRRCSICCSADTPEQRGPDASYALLHDRTSSSLHLPSADHGPRRAAGHPAVPDRGDRR